MAIVSQSHLRANMAKLLDQVESSHAELIVTRQGKDPLVIMRLEELESWKETLYLMSSEVNRKHLSESIRNLDAGKGIEVEFDGNGALVPVRNRNSA